MGVNHIRVGRRKSNAIDVALDFGRESEVHKGLDVIDANIVVNLAAMTDVDRCEVDLQESFLSNTALPELLSRWCISRDSAHLVHISTDHFYSHEGESVEADVTILNNYAMTKYAGELAVLNCGGIVLRTNFFGKSLNPRRQSFTDWIFESALHAKPIDGYTDAFFSPLHISSLCEAILTVCQRPLMGVFNLGSAGGMSKGVFVKRAVSAIGFSEELVNLTNSPAHNSRTLRPLDMRMNSTKFFQNYPTLIQPNLETEILKIKEEYSYV
jgi:dTDP-4-dehydrorhamnose reductase